MEWEIDFHDDFVPEYKELPVTVRVEIQAIVDLLKMFGPHLGRPRVDTLHGSRYANMKELRFDAEGGVWRFAFAFDQKRRAIIICGGDKSGGGEQRFYKRLIEKADERFSVHCAKVKNEDVGHGK